jgi:LysM repeat protein
VAVFLAIGGLLFGFLRSSIFVSFPAGVAQEQRVSGGSSLIPQAEGAEVDSAALTPASAPFLATISAGQGSRPVENEDVLYGEGALKDPAQIQKTKTFAPATDSEQAPTSSVLYQVAIGDTLRSISSAFGIPMNTIVQFNPSVNFSSLGSGTSIVIPGKNDIALLDASN